MSAAEPWQERAIALLDVLRAAVKVTHSGKFELRQGGCYLVEISDFEALKAAVEDVRLKSLAETESKQLDLEGQGS
ncbi:MAG TPA: hypothetical protein V6C84_16100 [Coleofasciculaceae cyanobacterium]|jgi:hypothetical protein